MLEQCDKLLEFMGTPLFATLYAAGAFDPHNASFRNGDVWHYLDGVAAQRRTMQDEGESRRLYRNLVELFGHVDKDKVEDHVEANMSEFKQQHGVPPRLASCHTGLINGKFVEGHVPADQVLALTKRDDLLGVAAPGMPMGSPGMEMDGMSDAYQVIGLKKDGADVVVADYPAAH